MDFEKIDEVFTDGIACEDCPYYREWTEREPYGETYVTRYFESCMILDGYVDDECPGEQ